MATEMSAVNDQGFKSGFAAKIMREEASWKHCSHLGKCDENAIPDHVGPWLWAPVLVAAVSNPGSSQHNHVLGIYGSRGFCKEKKLKQQVVSMFHDVQG